MHKLLNLTNQQFLKELEQRLLDFTQKEFLILIKIIEPYQPKIMKLIQLFHPQIHSWIQEKQEQLDQEKTAKDIKELKKSLAKK